MRLVLYSYAILPLERDGILDILFFFPKLGHILQGLALGLWHELPYEDGGNDTDHSIQAVGEPVAHAIGKWHEGSGDDPVENPLEGNGDGNGCTTDGIWEYLGDEHPADRSPRAVSYTHLTLPTKA